MNCDCGIKTYPESPIFSINPYIPAIKTEGSDLLPEGYTRIDYVHANKNHTIAVPTDWLNGLNLLKNQ